MPRSAVRAEAWCCELCSKEFSTMRGRDFHVRRWCPENPDSDRETSLNTARENLKAAPTHSEPEAPAESPPVDPEPESIFDAPSEPAKRPWRERVWGSDGSPKILSPKTSEAKPRKRRKSTEGIWQLIWTGVGRGLIMTSADIPVGNAMTFQGPVVGPIIDKAIAGTVIDTLLQPLAGAGERFEDVSDVVSLPGLVAIMERAPQLAPALEPLLRKAIRRHLVEYARMARAQKKEDAEYRKALDDLGMDPVADDPVDGIIMQIWAGATPPAEEPAMNGHAAGANVHP